MVQSGLFLSTPELGLVEDNYDEMTADSQDDVRFRFDFEVGQKTPDYSYNWPYDQFSLIELGQIEAGVDIGAIEPVKVIPKDTDIGFGGDVFGSVSKKPTEETE